MNKILMFRVPTSEILDELKWRTENPGKKNFDEFSSKQLLELILSQRMDSFGDI